MMARGGQTELQRAARRLGIAAEYTDAAGVRRSVGEDTLAALIALLDKDQERGPDRDRDRRTRARRGDADPVTPDVIVAWDGDLPPLRNRWPGPLSLRSEDGSDRPLMAARSADGPASVTGEPLPYGIHELSAGGVRVAWVVAAPSRADGRRPGEPRRGWGVFAPLYALRDERERPGGDLTCLEELGSLVGGLGASAVATLPLLAELATADGGPPGQQPYSPLSRMYWNEAYLDLSRLPELAGDGARPDRPRAHRASGRPDDHQSLADLATIASRSRPALDDAVVRLRRNGGERLASFESFIAGRPDLRRYARYRAAVETAGAHRQSWPASWRAGKIGAGDVPAEVEQRHCYAQWAMDDQLASVAAHLASNGVGLVMDLPIGCSAAGYDPWAFPEVYLEGASIGAPPDAFFTAGQNWGFPPPHPATDRREGYPVLRSCLAHNLLHASVLRVDHVLGWSRLWWIPDGMPADAGAYVRYPLEELLAVASLEAWRHGARLIGEDLGTVERGLRPKLARHGIAGMRVAVFDLGETPPRRLRPRAGTVAYLDTHDTATFAGWLDGSDIELRANLGLLDEAEANLERTERDSARTALLQRLTRHGALAAEADAETEPGPGARDGTGVAVLDVLTAVVAELGTSEAELVLVAVEDLWAERDPQNVPGTTSEHDNFARRLALPVEQLATDERALAILRRLDRARRAEPGESR